MVSMKKFFDKVMKENQEPELIDGDNQETEWNQDYFEEGLCPFCGIHDHKPEKMDEFKVVEVIFRCNHCKDGWVVIYFDSKPILFMPEYTFNKYFV